VAAHAAVSAIQRTAAGKNKNDQQA
jgi:hypothetical protein